MDSLCIMLVYGPQVDGVERFEPPGGFLSVDLQAAIVPLEMAPLSGGHASDYADSPVQEQQLDNLGLLKHQLSQACCPET